MVYKPFEGRRPARNSTSKIIWYQSNPGAPSGQLLQANNDDLLPCETVTSAWEDNSKGKTKMNEVHTELLFGEACYLVGKVWGETSYGEILSGVKYQRRVIFWSKRSNIDLNQRKDIKFVVAESKES